MDSGTGMLEPGTQWDVPYCTISMRWSKKSGTLWHVPQCTLWYMKGIPKSHGMAVGNTGQPSKSVAVGKTPRQALLFDRLLYWPHIAWARCHYYETEPTLRTN